MKTSTLVWGMIVRGLGWTASLGALFGALYSLFVIGLLFFVTRSGPGHLELPPFGLFFTMGILLAVGGAIVGGLIGLVFGPIGGLFAGLLTRLLFKSNPSEHYARTLRVAGGLYGAVATVIGLWIISGFNISPPTGATSNALLFYILPSLVGLGTGIYIAGQIATWYRTTSQGTQAVAPNSDGMRMPVSA